ncbi:hypothetical protein B0A53_05881 [Rhodotorula sp. CCFEE 5036]|nr:hypothetical protein B0A53_05881 [Rhodotorula sp. CCFEE 5036]
MPVPAVSRPPEAPRRRVLSSTNDLNRKPASPVLPSPRPIRAKVELGTSRSSPNASAWTPTQPVRARVAVPPSSGASPRGGFAGSPSTTPTAPPNAIFPRTGGSQIGGAANVVRATLSPQTPTTARAPSPVRSTSPDVNNARPVSIRARSATPRLATNSSNTPRADYGVGSAAPLRGQQGPFPTPTAAAAVTTTTAPMNSLSNSVSGRRLYSPTLRSPRALSASTAGSTASLPALSTSPGSSVSSTSMSPDLRAFAEREVFEPFTDKSRRLDGAPPSKLNGTAAFPEARLLPPLHVAGDDPRPLLARSVSALPNRTQAPPKSPSLQAIPSSPSRLANPLRSPTLSTSSAVTSRVSTTSRPPFGQQSVAQQRRDHTRSHSAASVSSLSSIVSRPEDRLSPPQPSASFSPSMWGYGGSPTISPNPASPAISDGGRRPLAAVDWLVAAVEDDYVSSNSPRSEGRLSSSSQGQASAASADVGIDGQEKEAKVDRRIADLEIRNASLLTINADLERLKVKHRKEIRDLRRKLRESVGGAGLALLRAQMSNLDEGVEDDPDDFADGSDDEGDASAAGAAAVPEPTWPEILEEDPAFSAVAARLESLIGRAKRAIEYEPARNETAGRVLSAAEVEAAQQFAFDPISTSTSTSTSTSASDNEGQRSRTITRSSSMRGLAIEGLARRSPTRR